MKGGGEVGERDGGRAGRARPPARPALAPHASPPAPRPPPSPSSARTRHTLLTPSLPSHFPPSPAALPAVDAFAVDYYRALSGGRPRELQRAAIFTPDPAAIDSAVKMKARRDARRRLGKVAKG